MKRTYPGRVNSPYTTTTADIGDSDTTIPVTELWVFPPGENLAVLGDGNTASMTSLVSPIGASYGTVPNSQAISMDSPSEGSYRVTWTSTWNAGTVSGTVGEIGFRGYGCTSLITGTMSTAQYAFLWRLCHADEHFQSFAIDTAKALTVSVNMVFTWS